MASKSKPRTKRKAKPRGPMFNGKPVTVVRDAKPTDKGFIGHMDQVLIHGRKGDQLVSRNEVF